MPETTPLIKAALNLRGGAGFDVYVHNNSPFFLIFYIAPKVKLQGLFSLLILHIFF